MGPDGKGRRDDPPLGDGGDVSGVGDFSLIPELDGGVFLL
jgi:hypothetical protein